MRLCYLKLSVSAILLTSSLTFFYFLLPNAAQAQVNFTANDIVPAYDSDFGYGANPGGHRGWRDEQLADIAFGNSELGIPGVGVTTLRPALTDKFFQDWGYNIRVNAFRGYEQQGARDNVVFIGYPSEEHRSTAFHCPDKQSEAFANIYQDIWDGGSNGTPYNDNNYYAAYVYEMVIRYRDYIRFYEVWNEPDFPQARFFVQDRNEPRNWWDNNPDPCDFEFHAPIFHYIRMLRITYEVVKTLDPDSYVAVGGLGKIAFLDAILRNTDNPNQGQVSSEYPLNGGAYFDVLSFHSYPHIDGSLQEWNNDIRALDYHRHSDAAVDGMLRLRDEFEEVLYDYGYDGNTYPEKEWIITETNLPRKALGEKIGSTAAQVNYLFKCMVEAQRAGIQQVHIYKLGDTDNFQGASSEFNLMGLYKSLKENPPYQQRVNDLGYALKTISDALYQKKIDLEKTGALNLPEGIRGAAFRDDAGEYTYVLWVVTTIDRSEFASATIDLSDELGTATLSGRRWEYARNQESIAVDPTQIELTGAPLIVFGGEEEEMDDDDDMDDDDGNTDDPHVLPPDLISAYPNPFTDELTVEIRLSERAQIQVEIVNRFGQGISVAIDATLEEGMHRYILDTSRWVTGVYFMQIRYENSAPIWVQLVKSPD
ncbi:MAG: T9SS type A sorting domain-containing protein [Bacteroidota bacterium]